MPTIQDLVTLAQTLPAKTDKLGADQTASHDALQVVADTTANEAAKVQAAQAAASVNIAAAQATADAAVAATEADKKDMDDTIDQIVAIATSLKQ